MWGTRPLPPVEEIANRYGVSLMTGGTPREVAKGASPTISPATETATWFADGQIWFEKLQDIGSKPPQSIHIYGGCSSFVWSPDGTRLAFVSSRGTHSFVVVFSPASDSLTFMDPGVDHDSFPVRSADGREIAFARVPYDPDENFDRPWRSGRPWSIMAWIFARRCNTGRRAPANFATWREPGCTCAAAAMWNRTISGSGAGAGAAF